MNEPVPALVIAESHTLGPKVNVSIPLAAIGQVLLGVEVVGSAAVMPEEPIDEAMATHKGTVLRLLSLQLTMPVKLIAAEGVEVGAINCVLPAGWNGEFAAMSYPLE